MIDFIKYFYVKLIYEYILIYIRVEIWLYDIIVIGVGQADLAIGYYLKQSNHHYVLLDQANEVGQSWRNKYDSLVLFTPRMYNSLPGMTFEGEQQGFPTKNKMVSYLKKYVERFQIPIHLDTEVLHVSKRNESFLLITNQGKYEAKHVVIATGLFHTPHIPVSSTNIPATIHQLHSSQYKNASQLVDGNVLVVGGGNSGAQIAVELSENRDTYLPLVFLRKSIFWWFHKIGILQANNHSSVGRMMQQKGDPIFGFECVFIQNASLGIAVPFLILSNSPQKITMNVDKHLT